MKLQLRSGGWVLKSRFYGWRGRCCYAVSGRVIANDSKLSRNYGFVNISGHGPSPPNKTTKMRLRPWRQVALRLRGCGAWAYYCLSLSKVRLMQSFHRKSLPRERSRWLQRSQPPKVRDEDIARDKIIRCELLSQSKSAIQEIHQNGVEDRLAMKRGGHTVRLLVTVVIRIRDRMLRNVLIVWKRPDGKVCPQLKTRDPDSIPTRPQT